MIGRTLVGCILLFMLVSISLATAINTDTDIEKKESPLWGIRARQAITKRIDNIIDNIKTKFIGERVFFIPFYWLINRDNSYEMPHLYLYQQLYTKYPSCADCTLYTSCYYTFQVTSCSQLCPETWMLCH